MCFLGTALIKLSGLFEHSSEAEFPLKMQSSFAYLRSQMADTRVCKSAVSRSHNICTQHNIIIIAINSTSLPAVANSACGFYCLYRGADKSLALPTSRCILFDGENISFDASLVIYI